MIFDEIDTGVSGHIAEKMADEMKILSQTKQILSITHLPQIAAKAVAFGEALTPAFQDYAAQIIKNAKAMAAVFAAEGVRMMGGGTDNHLIWQTFVR